MRSLVALRLQTFLRITGRQTTRFYSASASTKTALFDLHVQHGGKIVDFGGYLLPVQYSSDSITASHLHTREHCSLFDVSHMLQTKIHGTDRAELMERLTTADVRHLPLDKSVLTVFTSPETGGILDDLIITNSSEGYLYVASNAGRREHDSQLLLKQMNIMKSEKKDVEVELLNTTDASLIAIQGPKAPAALQSITKTPIEKIPFMSSTIATVGGIKGCRVSRCGYTGEDGFEVSVPSKYAADLVSVILTTKDVNVKLAGLGPRDSLRLEAGLCLYGSDIDETTTPVEAALTWLIPKSRRDSQDFPGAKIICRQLNEGVTKKRIGLRLDKGAPARHDCAIVSDSGEQIGKVTSGGPSPSLGYNIAQGYLDTKFTKLGTKVSVVVRGKPVTATVVKMPFLKTNYYSG